MNQIVSFPFGTNNFALPALYRAATAYQWLVGVEVFLTYFLLMRIHFRYKF